MTEIRRQNIKHCATVFKPKSHESQESNSSCTLWSNHFRILVS